MDELFWSIGTRDSATLGTIDEFIHSGAPEHRTAAIGLLTGASAELAFSHPRSAVHMTQECERNSRDLGDCSTTAIIGNAHVGSFQRAAG